MLGRKDYTREELENAQTAVKQQLGAYRKLAKAIDETDDPKAAAALEALEPVLFNNMTLALDRYFVHRLRVSAGKDGNPVNELELLSESLMNNGAVLRGNNVIKFRPDESVLGLEIGDRISIGAKEFDKFTKAFFAELETRFVK
jgi:hypothetical protein